MKPQHPADTTPIHCLPARFLAGDSYGVTATYFVAGGLITSLFSASLATHAPRTDFAYVLTAGMVIPSFTWLIQLIASAFLLPCALRKIYWGELGRACLAGSVMLLPAALANFVFRGAVAGRPENSLPLLWLSAANVIASVLCMTALLFRRSVPRHIAPVWPLSWCVTITLNMALFLWASRAWWPSS